MQNIREKVKRKLSMRDKNPNLDEHEDHEEIDEETTGHLHREIEKAERDGHPEGRPGSFLNRMISHGNQKTERQIADEHARTTSSTGGGVSGSGQMTAGHQALSSENTK